ncbi:MAG: SDR family oxidoreductase [Clostridium perfringens]|nr:SDR family oxidoreductase [Clostridium perfringens]
MKETVLITGATSGIGYEFSKIFYEKGYSLILLGRNKEILEKMESSMGKERVKTYSCDLSKIENVKKFFDFVDKNNIQIDILINNAGVGFNGYFNDISWDSHETIINTNIMALTFLTKVVTDSMRKRKRGKVLNVASTGSYEPGPLINVYYASKAYVLSFSQGLRQELKGFGVTVTALCPGATKTNFSKRAGKGDLDIAMSPKKVAEEGFKALMRNKAVCIPGNMNKLLVLGCKIMPSSISAKIVKNIQGKAMTNKA